MLPLGAPRRPRGWGASLRQRRRGSASALACPPRRGASPGWLLLSWPPEEGGAALPRGRKSARSFRRAEMTRAPRFRVGSRRRIPGRGDPGSRQRGGPRAQGGDASPRGGSGRHRQEEACRGEEKKADLQPSPTGERLEVSERALYPQIAPDQNLTRALRVSGN